MLVQAFPKVKKKKKRILKNKRITEYIPCRCGEAAPEWHEPLRGSNRQLSIKYKLQIPLCKKCHDRTEIDIEFAESLKREMQRKFEDRYSHDFYMRKFRRNYID